jgi:hypothetical protein
VASGSPKKTLQFNNWERIPDRKIGSRFCWNALREIAPPRGGG